MAAPPCQTLPFLRPDMSCPANTCLNSKWGSLCEAAFTDSTEGELCPACSQLADPHTARVWGSEVDWYVGSPPCLEEPQLQHRKAQSRVTEISGRESKDEEKAIGLAQGVSPTTDLGLEGKTS